MAREHRRNGSFARVPAKDRFWTRVDRSGGPNGCWNWQGATRYGYGYITEFWKKILAHRFAYELVVGPIPQGKNILHSCDNRICVNPRHLRVGTYADNNRDTRERGRLNPSRGEAHYLARLTESDVRVIRALYAEGALSYAAIAQRFNVAPMTISDVVRYRTWKHLA